MYNEVREKVAIHKLKAAIRFSRLKKVQGSRRIVPSGYSADPDEKALGVFLTSIKHAKWHPERPKSRTFYPSLMDVVVEKDAVSILAPVRTKNAALDKLQVTVDWIIANGRLPGCIEGEREHYRKLWNLQAIKEGKLQGIWYPEYDDMMANAGYPEFFEYSEAGAMIENNIDDLCKFYKKNKRMPCQLSEDSEERKLYRKLIRLRQVKQGKTPLKWNPAIDSTIKSKKIRNFFGG